MLNVIWFILLGCYLALTGYHLAIFFGRKEDKNNLYYAFLVLSFAFVLSAKLFSIYCQKINRLSGLDLSFRLIANCISIFFILLFSYYSLKYSKLKKTYGSFFILLVLIPCLIGILFGIITKDYKSGNYIFVIPSVVYGLFYWPAITIQFFLEKKYKVRIYRYIFLGITINYIFYILYPIFVLLKFHVVAQLITSNLGLLIFACMSAFALALEFNNEHKELLDIKLTLEQKVADRTKLLEQVNQQKIDAFINISHEIKTPLTLIGNYIDKHIKKYKKSEELDIAIQNVNKLKQDITNVLDFEKLEKDMLFYDHSQITDLSSIVERNVFQFKEILDRKGVNLKLNIAQNIYAKIDPNAFDSVVINLISNAIKFTKFGEINVNLMANNNKLELIISDTGIGISKEIHEHIFEPYFQVSHKKSNIQGIGMGLNITKKIIDDAGGKIEVESKLNEGTKFTIRLKKHILTDKDIVQERSEYLSSIDNIPDIKFREEKYIENKNNIFIVEDNLQMLSYLQENLIEEYNVFYARDGKEALEKLKNIPKPDIIIADIMMDVMDGYEFYDNIKKGEIFSDIPLLFLTAKSGINEKIKALSKGAVDFITKPFDLNELLFKLNSILEVNKRHEKKFIESIYKTSKEQLKEIDEKIEAIDYDKFKEKYDLTNKEIEICKLIRERLTNKEIGQRLNKAESTIKNYINIIFEKLFVNKREKAIELMDEFKMRKF